MSVVTPKNNKDLSIFINRVIPSYIIENYSGSPGEPSFPLFVQYFFEFLSQNYIETKSDGTQYISDQGAYLIIQNLLSYADVDETLTGFLQYFKSTYGDSFPFVGDFDDPQNTISTDLRRLIKNLRDFYLSKGTSDSIKFFFRAGFNQEASLYYPTKDILRVSAGTWFQPRYLSLLNLNDTPLTDVQISKLPDNYVIGQTSGAKGYIKSVDYVAIPNGVIFTDKQHWVSMATLTGEFVDGETVTINNFIDNSLLYTLKLNSRGYSTITNGISAWSNVLSYLVNDQVSYNGYVYNCLVAVGPVLSNDTPDTDPTHWALVYPLQPWRYLGNWKNDYSYKTGDIVYVGPNQIPGHYFPWVEGGEYFPGDHALYGNVNYTCTNHIVSSLIAPPEDPTNFSPILSFYIALKDFTSISRPDFNSRDFYNISSVAISPITNRVYRVNNNRASWQGDVSPESDPDNWQPLGLVSSVTNAWNPATTYNNGDIVQVTISGAYYAYQLRYFRTQFVNDVDPSSDMNNWFFINFDNASQTATIITPIVDNGTEYEIPVVSISPYSVGDWVDCYDGTNSVFGQITSIDTTNSIVHIRKSDAVTVGTVTSIANGSYMPKNGDPGSPFTYKRIGSGTLYNWSPTKTYYEDSIVLDTSNSQVYSPIDYNTGVVSTIIPSDPSQADILWLHRTDLSTNISDPTYPDWVQGSVYNYGDMVKFNDPVLGYTVWQLITPKQSPFLSPIKPSLNPIQWTDLNDTNYLFFDEIDNATKWIQLPSTVNPESIGFTESGDFPGYWLDHSGWLDSEKKIQDSFYYQDFSYQITTNLDQASFKDSLIKTVHPAGFQLFNVVATLSNIPEFSLALGMQLPNPPNTLNIDLRTPNYPNTIFSIVEIFYNGTPLWGSDSTVATTTIQNAYIPEYTLQTDYSTFEKYRENNLTFDQEILDGNLIQEFDIYSGRNTVLMFLNGLKIPSVPKTYYVDSGGNRYL